MIFYNHWIGRSWFPYDFPEGYYATVAYWVSSLQSGEWPQWIPYQSMGYPALMNPQIGLFYPPFWIFVLLRIPFTLHAAVIIQILHVLFGSVGFLLLAHRLFRSLLAAECGAAAFLLFGGFYTNAEHADIIRGFAWVPWLLWSALVLGPHLRPRNLLLPFVTACFITGAYTGQVIAGLFLLGLFLCFQAGAVWSQTRHTRLVGRILSFQFGLLALGVLLASPYLFTGAALSGELTRAKGIGSLPFHWLTGKMLFDLLFPSLFIHPRRDYSMYGMQLPVVLLLFIPLIGRKSSQRLLPLLATASVACLLSFQVFAPFSNVLRLLLPPLGLSRFPSGDYREFLYLAVLLLATGGLATAIRNGADAWRKTALSLGMTALFGLVCISCVRHDIAAPDFPLFLDLARRSVLIMLAMSLLLFVFDRWHHPRLVAVALLPLIPWLMLPALKLEHSWWSDPNAIAIEYGPGFPTEVNGQLRTRNIFRRHETARPPRMIADNHQMLSWWGYLDGVYLANDTGGVIPETRRTAESNPELLRFMLEGSRILQIPCESTAASCSASAPNVSIADRASAGIPLEYRRNSVTYNVDVPARSLIVENEMAIPGWHIAVDGTDVAMAKVNGCLRGWVVPAGHHVAKLRYQTPMLIPGLVVSLCALASWIGVLWWYRFRYLATKNPTSDCVILVSSDRTGG